MGFMSQLDTIQTIETPEGVEFDLYLAGPLARIWAALVDLGVRTAIYVLVAMPLALLGNFGQGLLLLTMFTVEWGYPIYFEMYRDGSTPGKRMMGLKVVNANGTPVSWKGSVLRNLLRAADFLPLGYALGIVAMAGTCRFQRLGDLAGDTLVCYRQGSEFALPRSLPEAAPVATPIALEVEEQRAIVRYAERSQHTGFARNAELARLVDPLTGTRSPAEGVARLQGLAQWITRGR